MSLAEGLLKDLVKIESITVAVGPIAPRAAVTARVRVFDRQSHPYNASSHPYGTSNHPTAPQSTT